MPNSKSTRDGILSLLDTVNTLLMILVHEVIANGIKVSADSPCSKLASCVGTHNWKKSCPAAKRKPAGTAVRMPMNFIEKEMLDVISFCLCCAKYIVSWGTKTATSTEIID